MALRPKEAARTANLTIEQALAYQAGETLALGDLPGGYTLLCCEGVSLGWGKQAGGMMKNHYPKGLRRRNLVRVRVHPSKEPSGNAGRLNLLNGLTYSL